jgi:two-component system KDP operon response regulator KdpE
LRIERDGLVIDLTTRLVTRDGETVRLTRTEFALLRCLATSSGTVTYRTIARKVWGRSGGDLARRVRPHIANLRAKLDGDPGTSVIETEIGIGYRFNHKALPGAEW